MVLVVAVLAVRAVVLPAPNALLRIWEARAQDHATLLRAARIVINEMPRVRFFVIGDATRAQLEALCSELRITPNVHFASARGGVARLLCAIGVFELSSATECFPIALLVESPARNQRSAPPWDP